MASGSPQILSYNDRQVEKRADALGADLIAEFKKNRAATIAAIEVCGRCAAVEGDHVGRRRERPARDGVQLRRRAARARSSQGHHRREEVSADATLRPAIGTPAASFNEREAQICTVARMVEDGRTYWVAGGGSPMYAVLLGIRLYAPRRAVHHRGRRHRAGADAAVRAGDDDGHRRARAIARWPGAR